MAPGLANRLRVFLPIALFGLLALGVWHWQDPRRTQAERIALQPRPSHEEPTRSLGFTSLEPQSPSALAQSSATNPPLRTKAETLSLALAQRPPALNDRQAENAQAELSADPERQHRHATRAARAKRLNQRLIRHIEGLEARLRESDGEQRSAILAELTQLRANLAKRQDLERAAIPAPDTRAGS